MSDVSVDVSFNLCDLEGKGTVETKVRARPHAHPPTDRSDR